MNLNVRENNQEINLKSGFMVPRWIIEIRRTMSKASIDLQDYLFYEFSHEWSKDYGLFFIASLATTLKYSENTIRKALKECVSKGIFFIHDLKIRGKVIFKNTLENQDLFQKLDSGELSAEVNLKNSLRFTNENGTIPFIKSQTLSLQTEGLPLKSTTTKQTSTEGLPLTVVEGLQTSSEGLKHGESIDNKQSQDRDRKIYDIDNIILYRENEKAPTEINSLTEKQKLYITYKNLRKNDSDYIDQLKEIFKENDFNLLQDWINARSYIQTESNIPYYLINSIKNKRALPVEYTRLKIETLRKELFNSWSGIYKATMNSTTNQLKIESSLALFISEILKSLEIVKKYLSADISLKESICTEKAFIGHQRFLQTVCKNVKPSKLQELVKQYLTTSDLKNRNDYLKSIPSDQITKVINSVIGIEHQSTKGGFING